MPVSSHMQKSPTYKRRNAHLDVLTGIKPTATLLEEDVDENGDLLPPRLDTINVNLLGCMYTVKLGIYYLKQNPNGGSIAVTASGSSTYYSSLYILSCRPSYLLSSTCCTC
jgi:hypothetical protein